MQGKLLSIGQVSKMKDISIKTLRFYDKIDLVKPFHVNAETGYRYYSHDQLLKIEMIRWLKYLDLSLDEIASIMRRNDPQIFAEFCSVQKQNALAKRRALDWAIIKLENFESRTHQSLGWAKHSGHYFRRIEDRSVLRKSCPFIPTSAEAYDIYSGVYHELRERNLETVYDTGSIVSLTDDGSLNYQEMFVVLIDSCNSKHYRDKCTTALPGGLYLCINYQNHNREERIKHLLSHIKQNQIDCLLCIEEDSCLNALDYSDPYYELQILVSTYQINEEN